MKRIRAKAWGARRGVPLYDETPLSRRLATLAILSLCLTLAVEFCNRGLSLPRLWAFITGAPGLFLCNWLIVFTSLAPSELFRRRRAVLGTVSLLWLMVGVVQYIVVRDRTTPFSSMDLLLIREALSLLSIYCTLPQIIAMFVGVFLVVALIIMLFSRARRRRERNLGRALVLNVGCALLCAMVATLGMHDGHIPQRFDSLVEAYAGYGFPLVFTYTFGQMGIARPSDYSEQTVGAILKDIDGDEPEPGTRVFDASDDPDRPNILLVQLESFMDVSTLQGCSLSRDPTPCFSRLLSRCPGGLLYVPTVGGGTVNTEFEILTGLNLDYFGAGESPYSTILQQSPCESVAYDLKPYGYTSTVVHNNGATFYNRNAVYPMLGIDCFVPLEYMQGVHTSALGWARDDVLTEEVLAALWRTDGRDLVMCITVESHGKYAEEYTPKEEDVAVLSLPEAVPLAPFQNYVNALSRTDAFLGDLLLALSDFDEPTVVVAYGDHLPALDLVPELLTTQSIYATPYVIWDNYDRIFDAPDLQAYRLCAHLMGQLGFSGGVISRLHQSVAPDEAGEEYLSKLEMLAYDMFYGDQQAFEGELPYAPTDMRLGSRDIGVIDAELDYGRLLVSGHDFTGYSKVVLDGQPLDTLYVDSEHIIAPAPVSDAPIGTVVQAVAAREAAVAQVNADGVELSRTAAVAVTMAN